MLNEILEFKGKLLSKLYGSNPSIERFIESIRECNETLNLNFSNSSPHWKNYLHATLISSYQILTSYDLLKWNEYFQNIEDIKEIFHSANPSESDVLELFVLHTINHVFNFSDSSLGILALKANNSSNPTFLADDSNKRNFLNTAENNRLIENLKIGMKLRGLPVKKIWGDNDIIVVMKYRDVLQQFCIISCKTSLRERVYQSIFWSMHSRLEGIGKHVFVTIDKGNSSKSEIGLRRENNTANKSRDVLESTMDRVYVLRNSQQVNRSQVIKDFSFLENDLKNWAKDIAGI